jgi:hypothetical protein
MEQLINTDIPWPRLNILFAKVGHSKLVEMHGALQIFINPHPSPIGILYSQLG